MHNWAKENNIVVIASSQLTRAVEFRGGTREPVLSDLRGSGRLEEITESIVFILRLEYYNMFEDENGTDRRNQIKLIAAKNSSGITGNQWLSCKNLPGQITEDTNDLPF